MYSGPHRVVSIAGTFPQGGRGVGKVLRTGSSPHDWAPVFPVTCPRVCQRGSRQNAATALLRHLTCHAQEPVADRQRARHVALAHPRRADV